jgi:hypothetical protein
MTLLPNLERMLGDAAANLAVSGGETAAESPTRGQHSWGPRVRLRRGLPRRRGRLTKRVRGLGLIAQVALLLTSVSALAAGGVASYLLISSRSSTRTLAAFECQITHESGVGVNAVTGDPLIDCAAAWPSATEGRRVAPKLSVWGTTSGREDALVQPASWGPPRNTRRVHWRPLSPDWTVDLQIVALNDQLSNISVNPTGIGLDIGRCTRAQVVVAAVRSFLGDDGLRSWHVEVGWLSRGPAAAGCHPFLANVDPKLQTVQLLALPGQTRPRPIPRRLRKVVTAEATALQKLRLLYRRVNRILATRCDAVATAAALWSRQAKAAGFSPTTLALWRAANAVAGHQPASFAYHYSLFTQPASQPAGSCARVLVMVVPGSGLANVYAARITP